MSLGLLLNLIYAMCVENLDAKEREDFDFELLASDEEKRAYDLQARRDRMNIAAKYGETG